MPLFDELLIALVSMAIWEICRRLFLASRQWYRTRDAFKKLMKLEGDVLVVRSVVTRGGKSFVRDSDAEVERLLAARMTARMIHQPLEFSIQDPSRHLIIIGSSRYNVAVRAVQQHFMIPFQFVFSSSGSDPASRQLVVVTEHGDEMTSSIDLLERCRAEEVDYGILFVANLTNGKRLYWIAGIHGAGTLGVFHFMRSEAALVRQAWPAGADVGVAWLLRVRYETGANGGEPKILSMEVIGNACMVKKYEKPPSQALILDLGNVVMEFDRTRTYRAIAHVLGRNFQQIQEAIERSDVRQRYESGTLDTNAFLDELYRILKCDEGLLPRRMLEEFWGNIFWERPPMHETLKALHQEGVPIVLLSNTNPLHFDQIRKDYPDLVALFNKVVLSYSVRSVKPDRRIFEEGLAAVRAYCEKFAVDRVLYVDDKSQYVRVAEEMGMRGFTYRSHPQFVFWLRRQRLYVE